MNVGSVVLMATRANERGRTSQGSVRCQDISNAVRAKRLPAVKILDFLLGPILIGYYPHFVNTGFLYRYGGTRAELAETLR
jgi:hypothetical protein